MDKFIVFNLFEGIFWIFLGILSYIFHVILDKTYKNITLVSSFFLVSFGISDFFELWLGSFFEPGLEWLYIWKAVNLGVLVLIIIWFFKIKLFNE